ncbi:AraC family transcriptional regulator [uncultured Roseobacter sp.]|uniref:AraC family transcriptional regulator n=1 Tax=uncultured Roseobacter sp. TaxID=114847 RepID=UPI0026364527|nr:AraC family transcriptional regulator [uncultured Roseobacter sp.]
MPNDPLSDIVRALDLTGGVFLDAEFSAPWAIASKVSEEDCQPFLPVPKQVIAYHVVTEGQMMVALDDRTEQMAQFGDVVFLPSNAWHVLSSDPGLSPALGDDLVLPAAEDGLASIRFGGGGARTRILCGFIASSSGPSPLLETLPETLVIRIEDVATRRWLEASIAMAARELTAGRVSSNTVMAQLSELLLVEALRAYLETADRPSGWLAGMADPQIATVLARVHRNLANPHGIEALARETGMSRSTFVDRFTEIMGVAPGGYVLTQRMQTARSLLRDTPLPMSEIAYRVGYDAPEAFSRAFKRCFGVAPAEWRADASEAPE